jgi:hypothetical protein
MVWLPMNVIKLGSYSEKKNKIYNVINVYNNRIFIDIIDNNCNTSTLYKSNSNTIF